MSRKISAAVSRLIATYRDEEVLPSHPRWSRLATLRREPDVTGLPLGRLDPAEPREMLAVVFPGLPDGRVEDIVRRSAGTPLVVEELALAGVAAPGRPDHVPDIVRATVRDRLRLDEITMSRAIATVLDCGRFNAAVQAASSRLRRQNAVATASTLVESLSQ